MKCQKMKKYLYRGLSVFISLYLGLCSSIGSYASDSTSSGATDTWTMNAGTFLELAFQGFAKEISSPYVVWNALSGLTYDGFNVWLQNQDNGEHYHLLEDGTVVGHGGAGYSRPSDKIDNSTQIDVDPQLTQYVLNYVQYCTTQTSLGYKQCYIYSYNFLSPNQFSNYQQYATLKEYIKNNKGWTFVTSPNGNNGFTSSYVVALNVPLTKYDLTFYGTTTQGGFTSVNLIHGWSQVTQPPINSNTGVTYKKMFGNGSITNMTSYENWGPWLTNIKNISSVMDGTNTFSVFSSNEKNELVYVFDTINSYKNYNAGMAQPYYLTTEGINTGTWTASGGGIINTGSMNNSGNYYSSVTSGVGTNWTPDQILALVDKVTSTNGGSGGSGGSSGNDNSSIWEKLGETLGNLVDGIINVFVNLIQHLSDGLLSVLHLLFGYTDDDGVEHAGLFDSLIALISTNLTGFLGTVFDFLPSEIVTCFTTVVVLSVLFAIFRFMRR